MTESSKPSKDEGVGYGRPPKSTQFKEGQSGNPNGRPKKPDSSVIDLGAILADEVLVNGAPMDPREVELRQQVKKALDPKGSLKATKHVLDRFEKHGAMAPPPPKRLNIELPSILEVPMAVQRLLLGDGLAPPWTPRQLAKARKAYLENRDESDRIFDKQMGYEEWLKT